MLILHLSMLYVPKYHISIVPSIPRLGFKECFSSCKRSYRLTSQRLGGVPTALEAYRRSVLAPEVLVFLKKKHRMLPSLTSKARIAFNRSSFWLRCEQGRESYIL